MPYEEAPLSGKTVDPNLVRVERAGEIAVLTLDKPPVNALFLDLFDAIGRVGKLTPKSLDH